MARALTRMGELASTSMEGRGQSMELGWGWKGAASGWGRGGRRKGEPLNGKEGKGEQEKGSLLFFLQTNHGAPGVSNSSSCSQM